MSYKVLSRKYRPKIFAEVVGQENALTILKSFIQTEAIPHALIFSGPRGIGKTSLARIFAKTVNCIELQANKDCLGCSICSDIDENKSLDVIEIDAASNNGVDQIREVIESSNYSSINCQFKVFIIDEVHMLSKAAFNALLKTLEEPNKNTIFILATTEVEKIPLTILSRCQAINFKTLEKTTLIENLKNVCEKENISIDSDSLSLVAEESRGSARDSLGILEQLMTSLDKNISIDEARKILGTTSNQILFQMSQNLLMSNTSECLKNYAQINNNGYDSKKFIHSLLNYFRSAIYYKLGIQNEIEDIVAIQESEVTELIKYDLELFENLFDELIKLYEMISRTQNVKFLIESNLIKLCLISSYLSFDEIIDDEKNKEKIVSPEIEINNSKKKVSKGSENSVQKKNQKIITSEFSSIKFLDNLKKLGDENFKLLSGCSYKTDKSNVTITTSSGLIHEILKETEKVIVIEKLIKDFFNADYKVKILYLEKEDDSKDSEDFKFTEKKDKLFESETMKNLFSTFDCRVLNIEKDK